MYTTHKEAFYFASWKALFICLKPPLFQKKLRFFLYSQSIWFYYPIDLQIILSYNGSVKSDTF